MKKNINIKDKNKEKEKEKNIFKINKNKKQVYKNENKEKLEKEKLEKEKLEKEKLEKEKLEKEKLEKEKLEKELEIIKNQLLRIQAEFENYKKRSKKELGNMMNYGIENLVLCLLPVLDNFDRALNLESEKENDKNFYKGMILIKKQLIDSLGIYGLKKIDSLGQVFNPIYHNGVINEFVDDDELIGKIIEEMQVGYLLNNKVIRPSMVKIGIKK